MRGLIGRTRTQNRLVSSQSLARFLLQAAFIIAAATVAAVVHLAAVAIIGVVAGAFAVVALTEWAAMRKAAQRSGPRTLPLPPLREPRSVRVRTADDEQRRGAHGYGDREPVRQRRPEPTMPSVTAGATSTSAQLRPAPASTRVEPAPPQPVRRSSAASEGTVRVAPRSPLPAASVAAPPAGQQPAAPPAAPPPPPVAPPVVERRRWNVFELERRARQIAGADPARDEELTFLLLHLREFGDISGELDEQFDPFVRESFPDLI
jgi:hypothetical protein